MKPTRLFGGTSSAVVVLTFVLFAIALFTTGFTHDLLLEAGVFVVSIKLIMMAHQNHRIGDTICTKLERIDAKLDQLRGEHE